MHTTPIISIIHTIHTIQMKCNYHTYHTYNSKHTMANHTTPTLHRKFSMPVIVTIHTIQTIHTVISNIPCPTDLHTIPTIHTKHTILSKHAIPDRPYTPYIPNIPYHTPTTPQGGEGDSATPPPHHRGGGGRSHMGPVYGTHPMGGGGVGGRAWCIYIHTYTSHDITSDQIISYPHYINYIPFIFSPLCGFSLLMIRRMILQLISPEIHRSISM